MLLTTDKLTSNVHLLKFDKQQIKTEIFFQAIEIKLDYY